ncbi:hypothetical protein [Pedobacter heparinus]|uniref:hypothetical protein n=1 Tax=Pedobacter heparinus TaxID=984 RepID=UPI00292E259E|nr:hypothetical protein [Pedobacter heparinus]
MDNRESPVVKNYLVRIGVLLMDMKRALDFEVDNDQLVFLEGEFERIQTAIAEIWADKPIGLAYFLEFHLAEARRLKGQINLKALIKEVDKMTDADIFRINIYTLLKYNLNDLITLLNKLIKGEGINITIP